MQRSSGYGERLILTPGSENKEGMGEGDSQTRAFSLESSTHKQADQRTTQTIHMQVTEANWFPEKPKFPHFLSLGDSMALLASDSYLSSDCVLGIPSTRSSAL